MRNGARMYAVDPRRTSSAAWADVWLGIDVGADIALANAIGREIIAAGLVNRTFIERATSGFEAYRAGVERYTLDYAQRLTGVDGGVIREMAHAYARADRAQVCWTLGITEHHNAVDNVFGIINLALLTGHVGRYGSGLVPLRGQNNVQGGGDMGALPNKFPGGQDVEDADLRAKFERAYGTRLPTGSGWHLSQMFDAMEHGELRSLYVIGENPAQSEADTTRTARLLGGLDHLVVQDIFLTKTAELAHVVLPGRRVVVRVGGHGDEQRAARPARQEGARAARRGARRHRDPLRSRPASRPATGGARPRRRSGTSCARLSPWHGGMSYRRLEELGGLQWPCPDEHHPGSPFLHGRLWEDPIEGPRAPFTPVEFDPPVDELTERVPDPPDDGPPARFLQHRRADRRLHIAAHRRRDARPLAPRMRARLGVARRRARPHRLAPRRRRRARAPRRSGCDRAWRS